MSVFVLESTTVDICIVCRLPSGDWFYLLGPQNSSAKNMVLVWPSLQPAHWLRLVPIQKRRRLLPVAYDPRH